MLANLQVDLEGAEVAAFSVVWETNKTVRLSNIKRVADAIRVHLKAKVDELRVKVADEIQRRKFKERIKALGRVEDTVVFPDGLLDSEQWPPCSSIDTYPLQIS